MKCFEIITFVFVSINILSIIFRIIIQFKYNIVPFQTIVYAIPSFTIFVMFFYILKQNYVNSSSILGLIFLNLFIWIIDFSRFHSEINNCFKRSSKFLANFFYGLIIGEISLWALIFFLVICLTYKRTGKICYPEVEDS